MSELQERLADRDEELEVYVQFLKALDGKATLNVSHGRGERRRHVDERVTKILKANFFLLLYNLVEASVREALRLFYEAVRSDGCTVKDVTEELRHLWIDAAVDRVRPRTANQDSYRNVARQLVQDTVRDVQANLVVEDRRFGGNLDADQIRRMCQEHGVPIRADRRAKGGEKLRLVKSRRNDLAHGVLSFSECGRDYTLAQLLEVRHETVLYVRGVLRSVEHHATRKGFRADSGVKTTAFARGSR